MVQLQGAEAQHAAVRNEMTDFWQGMRWAPSWIQKPFTDTEYSIPDTVKIFAASLLFCARHLHGTNGEGAGVLPHDGSAQRWDLGLFGAMCGTAVHRQQRQLSLQERGRHW